MDTSDDELATNDTTTTPFRATKPNGSTLKPSKAKAKVNGRQPTAAGAVAGPSSSNADGTTQKTRQRRKRSPSPVHEIEDDEDEGEQGEVTRDRGTGQEEPIMIDVDSVEGDTSDAPPRVGAGARGTRSKRAPSREPEATKAIRTNLKGKGKASTRRPPSPASVMEIDDTDAQGEESDVFVQPRKGKQDVDAGTAAGSSSTINEKEFARLQRENERLRNQVEELKRHRSNMVNQLEELTALRHTEAEQNLEQLKQNYESRLQIQEEAICELTSSSEFVNALGLHGKTSSLHYLSAEAAAMEQTPLKEEINRLETALDKRKKDLAESGQRVKKLEDTVRMLEADMKAEIENSKRLNTNVTRPLKKDELKHGWVTKLYEDMTNLLVISVRQEDVGDVTGETEHVYTCVYSATDAKGLTFNLRLFPAEGDNGEKVDKCLYTPSNLDNESPEFVANLGFLSDTFTFYKSQLDVFYERLKSTIADAMAPPEEEDGDN